MGCSEPVASSRAAVVYGEDGRTEVFAHPNAALRAVAESAVAMKIDRAYVDATDPDALVIDYTRTLAEAKDLCAGERFADQIEPGTCSGTLIDDQYLLTAGHCVDEPDDCTDAVWLFGFRYVADGTLATLTEDDVYSCSRVLAYFDDGDVDHAVVELDRPVVGHTPATVRIEPAGLALGTPLALIGHPNGIPMKIDDGGEVTWTSPAATFLNATLDAFNGNSGSGVFDHTGQLVALLRGGMDDYVDSGGCSVVNVIDPPPTDDGEELTYVRPALDAFCAEPGIDSALCDCDGPCVPALPGDQCTDAVVIDPVSQVLEGDMALFAPDSTGSCGGAGRDRVWTFTTDRVLRFTARSAGYGLGALPAPRLHRLRARVQRRRRPGHRPRLADRAQPRPRHLRALPRRLRPGRVDLHADPDLRGHRRGPGRRTSADRRRNAPRRRDTGRRDRGRHGR